MKTKYWSRTGLRCRERCLLFTVNPQERVMGHSHVFLMKSAKRRCEIFWATIHKEMMEALWREQFGRLLGYMAEKRL